MANIVKIKGRPIGIFGLELALAKVRQARKEQGLGTKEAAVLLLEMVEKKNYIPESIRPDYIRAFEALLENERQEDEGHRVVRILGPGCIGCNRIERLVMEILSEKGIPADIYHVTDRDEIYRYGVDRTPALVIDETVVSAGKIPSKAEIERWLVNGVSS